MHDFFLAYENFFDLRLKEIIVYYIAEAAKYNFLSFMNLFNRLFILYKL